MAVREAIGWLTAGLWALTWLLTVFAGPSPIWTTHGEAVLAGAATVLALLGAAGLLYGLWKTAK